MAPLHSIAFENISNNETVHQRCVLIAGQCISSHSDEDFLSVNTKDAAQSSTFPVQNWPINEKHFKSLVILSPGDNYLTFQHMHKGLVAGSIELRLTYVPLLQTPPLHLAIMIAKDSPLIIDCPPHKRGGISSAHSDLNAAINKFRMTAYMWQALTAEDMRSKGLGRRSFRIEEEWAPESLSREFLQAANEASAMHMHSTAKIHLVKSEKTVAELRDANIAQQNKNAQNDQDLFKFFEAALKNHGAPFASSAHPVVAGLILDSAYSLEQNLILGHAALGCSNPRGISLGMFGSHLTYSWPRFLEEVPACLLDTAVPGDSVGNDNGECASMWEACSIGQGAFLHEVGHAFGAPHTSGIMARGYAREWPKNFLSKTAASNLTQEEGFIVTCDTHNEARWDISDALSFRLQSHFRLPSDPILAQEKLSAIPSIQVVCEEGETDFWRLVISCPSEIALLKFNGEAEAQPTAVTPVPKIQFTMGEIEARFSKTEALRLEVLGMNGKTRVVENVWRLFSQISFIRVPGSSIILRKRSFMSSRCANTDNNKLKTWDWAVMLKEKGPSGKVSPATTIDSRVGCILDGAVVYFEDGHKTPCGPRWETRQGKKAEHYFGGHASETIKIPSGAEVVKVEVGCSYSLDGLRFHLSDGSAGGYLYDGSARHVLEPDTYERIVGFYGRSDYSAGGGVCAVEEFGIITAPKDVELPEAVYDLPELQNTDGSPGTVVQQGHAGNHHHDDVESEGTVDGEFDKIDEDDMQD